MAEEVFIKKKYLQDIANAIREKNGRDNTYMPYEFSSAIRELADSKISDLEEYMRSGEILYSGYEGDCPWVLTSKGTLVIGDPTKTTYLSEEYLSNPWSLYNLDIHNIIFNGKVVVPEGMVNMFSGMKELWLIFNIWNLDTSLVKDFRSWFEGCENINTIDLTSWDASNVRGMNWMFKGCSSLVEVKLPQIFHECEMIGMFSYSGFVHFKFFGNKVLRSSNLTQMFYHCENLISVDLAGIDISKVKYMQEMFAYCPLLKEVNIEPIFAPNLISMQKMFAHCYSLEKNPEKLFWKVPSLKDLSYMFEYCINLKEFYFDMPVFSIENISGMFSECYNLEKIDWTNWINFFYKGEEELHNTSPFHDCWGLKELITGSRTMLSTQGWQKAHFDAYVPKSKFTAYEGIKPGLTNYTEVNTTTETGATIGYRISGAPGYELLNSVEAGLRIDWRSAYTDAVQQEVMDFATGQMVMEGMYTPMNSQYTPAVNLPYSDLMENDFYSNFYKSIFKAMIDTGMSEEDAKTIVNIVRGYDAGYLKDASLALPYYMVEQNTGLRSYYLALNQPCHYIREDTIIESTPYYYYPSMHNFLSQNFSIQFAQYVIKHIKWRTNILMPLEKTLPAEIDDRTKKKYNNSLSWEYDWDTKTLIVATPEDRFYLPADSSGMFSGMVHLEDFSFEKIDARYCCNYAYMFNDCGKLKNITNFAMNAAVDKLELVPFQDPCDETWLEDIANYNKVHRGYDAKQYDWYYIYGLDTMFKGCVDLRSITFSDIDWGRLKTINRATKTYNSTLRKMLQQYVPTLEEIIIEKEYNKTNGYEQLSTDEIWYRLPLGNVNEVILSKYDPNRESIIPNYNINVKGLIEGPGRYIRERAVTDELWERSFGMDDNIFYSGLSLRHMIDDFLESLGMTSQDLKRIEFRTHIITPRGTQYKKQKRTKYEEKEYYEGPYLYYNVDKQGLIIQTRADRYIVKDNAEYTFHDMPNLYRIGNFNKIYWENITNVSHLFDGCTSLYSIDLSNMQLETLTDTSYMFNNCILFEFVDLSNFDFSEVLDMEYMFNNCWNLKEIKFSENINTTKVTDMTHLFCNCNKLGIINFKDFDTDNVQDMSYMFYNCEALENANFSNFNTCKVKDMSYMFTGCINLKNADFSSLIFCRKKDGIFAGLRDEIYECLTAQFNPENIYFNNLFEGCTATHLDLSNFNWHMARDMQKMFKDCVNLQSLDMGDVESPWVYSLKQMFYNCETLTTITFTKWRTKSVTDVEEMFSGCKSLIDLDFVKMDFNGRLVKASMMFMDCESLPSLDMSNCYLYCNCDRIFYNCKSLTAIIELHGKYVPPLGYSYYWRKPQFSGRLFYNCQSLEELDLSNFNFREVYNYSYMFYNCKSLKNLDLHYSVSFNGPLYEGMFKDCEQLKYLILPDHLKLAFRRYYNNSGWTCYTDITCNQFKQMFYNCKNLIEISGLNQLSTNGQFDKSSNGENQMVVWNLSEMFYNCQNLITELDFSKFIPKIDPNAGYNWITGSNKSWLQYGGYDIKLTSLKNAFYNCHSLTTIKFPNDRPIDLINYAFTQEFQGIFDGCYNLEDLTLINLKFGTWRGTKTELSYSEGTSNNIKYNLNRLFKDCRKLKNIDLSTWVFQTYHNIAQATGLPYNTSGNLGLINEDIGNMASMFENCYELEKIIWPIGTKSVGIQPTYDLITGVFPWMYIKNANKMFKNCYKLTEIEQQCYPEIIFNTIVTAEQMMMNCKSIDTNIIKLCSNYLENMNEIFAGCESMTYLDFRKHRTMFNYTSKNNGLLGAIGLEQMDIGQFYDGRTQRFVLDIEDYSYNVSWISGSRGDIYVYIPTSPGYDNPPNYRPYLALNIDYWNELVQRAKSTYGKYIWIAVGGYANQNANSSIGSSTIRLLRDRPLYYSNWTTYQGGWVVPSSGGIAFEWDRAPLTNIDENAYIIQRKDSVDVTTTIIWNLNINGFRIDSIDDTTKNIIITSHNNTWSHTYGNNGYISNTDNYQPHFIWKSDRTIDYEVGQQVKVNLWNDNSEIEYYLTLTSQMINFLNTDKDIYDYYFISAIGSSGSWGTDLWRFPRGIEFDYIEQNDGIKINFLNNIKNYYSGGGVWDGTRPIQWYALLDVDKVQPIDLNTFPEEANIYPMQFPKPMYTGVQNMYTTWTGNIPIKVETYYEKYKLPEKYNSRLVTGSEFSYTIKRMANGASVTDGNFNDTKIKHIVFENGIKTTGTTIGSQGSPVVANWDNDTGTITISFEIAAPIILNKNCNNMFYMLNGLQSIEGLNILDTSEVESANSMFKNCGTNLLELDLRTWDMSNCEDMQNIFTYCIANLVNITDWNVTSLLDIVDWSKNYVFFDHAKITTLNAENLDFSNITNLCCMFINAEIPNLNIQNWNVSNIGNFRSIFDRLKTNILNINTWDTSSGIYMSYMFQYGTFNNIIFDQIDTSNVIDMQYMFAGCTISEINISTWNVSNVVTTYRMFYDTKIDLTVITLSSFNTEVCTNMSQMFCNCRAITVTLSDFNITACISMYGMFKNTYNLQNLNITNKWKFHPDNDIREMFRDSLCIINSLENFDTSILTNMHQMFYGYKGTELIFTNWNTSHCLYMSEMFAECTNLITLKIQTFDTSKVRNFEAMFYNCSKLEIFETNSFILNANDRRDYWYINSTSGDYYLYNRGISSSGYRDWGSFNSGRTSVGEMFWGITIPLNIGHWDVSKQVNFSTMFGGYKGTIIDLSEWNISYSTKDIIWRMMFNNCSNLQYVYLTSFWTENVSDIAAMFANCTSLIKAYFRDNKIVLPAVNINTYGMYVGCTCDLHVEEWDLSKITTLNSLFRSYRGTTIDLSSWVGKLNHDQISGMNATFYDCNNLINLDLSGLANLDTIKDFGSCFAYMSNIITFDLTYLNTNSATSFYHMFYACPKLENLNFNNFVTDKVTNMEWMFAENIKLQALDLTNFNTFNVTNFKRMFYNCQSIEELLIPNFNTSKWSGDNAEHMFYNCQNLKELYLPDTFTLIDNTSTEGMFRECHSIKTIRIPETFGGENLQRVDRMFEKCYLLEELIFPDSFISMKCTNFQFMFWDCNSLKKITQHFNMTGAFSTTKMLENCFALEEINTYQNDSGWLFSKVKYCQGMFNHCHSLKSLDLQNVNFTRAGENSYSGSPWEGQGSLTYLFGNCYALEELNINSMFTDHCPASNISDMFVNCHSLTTLSIHNANFTNLSSNGAEYLFAGCWALKSLDLKYTTFKGLTSLKGWFQYCHSLKYLDWYLMTFTDQDHDTTPINNLTEMFMGCNAITKIKFKEDNGKILDNSSVVTSEIDMTTWNVGNVTNTDSMFASCNNLITVDIAYSNFTKIQTSKSMFKNCISLEEVIFPENYNKNINQGAYIYYDSMFEGCITLDYMEIPNLIVNGREYYLQMPNMFKDCSSLKAVEFRNAKQLYNYSNSAANCLSGCSSLENIYFSECDGWTGGNSLIRWICNGANNGENFVTLTIEGTINNNFNELIRGANRIKKINMINWIENSNGEITLHETNKPSSLNYAFAGTGIYNLRDILMNFVNVTNYTYSFSECSYLTTLDTSIWNMREQADCNFNCAFRSGKMTTIDASKLSVEKINNLNNAFEYCSNLISMIVPQFISSFSNICRYDYNITDIKFLNYNNTEKIRTFLNGMSTSNCTLDVLLDNFTGTKLSFNGYRRIKSFNIINSDTSKITNLNSCFRDTGLLSFDFDLLDVSNVSDMAYMFYGCSSLSDIHIGKINTPLLKTTSYMFRSCSILTSLDCSEWTCSAVENFSYIFEYCSNLNTLDISGWNFNSITNSSYMFRYAYNLRTIYARGAFKDFKSNSATYLSSTGVTSIYVPLSLIDKYKKAYQWKDVISAIKDGSNKDLVDLQIKSSLDEFNSYEFDYLHRTAQLTAIYIDPDNNIDVDPNYRGVIWSIEQGNALVDENGLVTLTSEMENNDDIIIRGTCVYNNEITSTITIRVVYIERALSIDLYNEEWIDSNLLAENKYPIYQSNAHTGVHNSKDRCEITIMGYDTFVLKYRSNGESNYDYLWIGLDKDINNLSDSNFTISTKGSPTATYKTYTFTNLKKANHKISIVYRKDGSRHENEDKGFFYIPQQSI